MVELRLPVTEHSPAGKVTTNLCACAVYVKQVSVVISFSLPVDTYGNLDEIFPPWTGCINQLGKRGLATNIANSKQSINIPNRIQEYRNNQKD